MTILHIHPEPTVEDVEEFASGLLRELKDPTNEKLRDEFMLSMMVRVYLAEAETWPVDSWEREECLDDAREAQRKLSDAS
jgi:hypothetical protein